VGCLRLTAPVECGQRQLAPLLPPLLRHHPKLSIHLDPSNRVVDVVEEGLDAAIRIAPTLDTALRGRPATTSRLLLLAAPGCLRRHGAPKTPEALQQYATLSSALGIGRHRVSTRDDGRRAVDVAPRLLTTSPEVVREAACAGAGIAMLPTVLVDEALAQGALCGRPDRLGDRRAEGLRTAPEPAHASGTRARVPRCDGRSFRPRRRARRLRRGRLSALMRWARSARARCTPGSRRGDGRHAAARGAGR
jgi:DNA-binding transcriptional LysR family regulator